jgi:hypothetical protein
MARGGHGLPKVSPGPAISYPPTPCERATPETALHEGGGSLLASSTPLDTPRRTPKVIHLYSHCYTIQVALVVLVSIKLIPYKQEWVTVTRREAILT